MLNEIINNVEPPIHHHMHKYHTTLQMIMLGRKYTTEQRKEHNYGNKNAQHIKW